MSELKQKWLALKSSERRMAIYGLLLISISIVYFYAWKPYTQLINHYQQQILFTHEDMTWLEQVSRQIQQLRTGSAVAIGEFKGSFIDVIDKSIKQNRLNKFVGVLENSGSDKVLVQFNKVSFNALISWVAYIKKRYGILVKNIDVQRDADTDKVNARIILKKN